MVVCSNVVSGECEGKQLRLCFDRWRGEEDSTCCAFFRGNQAENVAITVSLRSVPTGGLDFVSLSHFLPPPPSPSSLSPPIHFRLHGLPSFKYSAIRADNKMSSRQNEASEPLLPSSSTQQSDEVLPITPLDMVRHENLSRHSISIQASALLFVAVVWSIVFSSFSPLSLPLFGYHPLIQSFTILLLLQAIIVLQRTTTSQPSEKKAAFTVHQYLNLLLVLPLFTAGASIMWYLHDQPNSAHFISYHGILGTAVVAAAWVQAALGAASVWWKGKLVGGENKGKALWKWHRLSGYVLVGLFLVTAVLGVLETTWSKNNAGNVQKLLVVVGLGLSGFALLIRVRGSKMPKLTS